MPYSVCSHPVPPPPLAPRSHSPSASPSHPCQQQLHLQLCNPAAQATPDPVAKGHGAKWVLALESIRLVLPQPALGLEAVRLREDAGVPGHHIMAQDKLCLQRKKGQHISVRAVGRGGGGGREPWLSSPTHILGKEEATNFDFLVCDDPGVHRHHRVEAAGK